MSSPSIPLFGQAGNNQFGNYGTGMPQIQNTANPVPGVGVGSVQVASGAGASGGTPPGIVPAPPNTSNPVNTNAPHPFDPHNPAGPLGGIVDQPGTGANTESTLYPNMTQDYYNWLTQQIGTGITPFNLSTQLPSSGQATQPGQVNAPLTQLLSQLQNFYSTGAGGPAGSNALASIAQNGNPTDVGPAWDAMVKAQQQNIGQNEAQIREQFASLGNLKGSPFGTALTNFGEQTTLDQNSLLAQMQQQASEAAAGRQQSAATGLVSGANTLGTTLQGVDQSAIQNLIQQYQLSQPQNNPLNSQIYGASNSFAPFFTSGSGGILAGLIPALASGAGAAASTALGGGGGMASLLAGLAAL